MSVTTSGPDKIDGHDCRVVKGTIPGTWRATCTCGELGALYGSKGALSAARHDKWTHIFDVEDARARPETQPA